MLLDCKIEVADTPDQYCAALKVTYETALGKDKSVDGYISRSVLIETCARSAREPASERDITPYIQDVLAADDWKLTFPKIITLIKPERTFWTKSTSSTVCVARMMLGNSISRARTGNPGTARPCTNLRHGHWQAGVGRQGATAADHLQRSNDLLSTS